MRFERKIDRFHLLFVGHKNVVNNIWKNRNKKRKLYVQYIMIDRIYKIVLKIVKRVIHNIISKLYIPTISKQYQTTEKLPF